MIPGFNMPVPTGTLNPSTANYPAWTHHVVAARFLFWSLLHRPRRWGAKPPDGSVPASPLDAAGNYFLLFGVTNWNDQFFDSGLAIDGVTVDGEPITARTPEPASLLLLGIGAVPLLLKRRRS